MPSDFLIYGANGYVGEAAARQAVEAGLRPILAGRSAPKIEPLAAELGLEARIFDLDDPLKVEQALAGQRAVLHLAGPYIYTYRPLLEACLRTGAHYLDITGEIPVYQAIAGQDEAARGRGVMLMPGVGFDVVPTDCLAAHLQQRLPTATHLALAFTTRGPAGLPPGTQRTAIEALPYGADLVRRGGRIERPPATRTRLVDFGRGPVTVTGLTWGDIFTAYYTTGIPNIETYIRLPRLARRAMAALGILRPLFRLRLVRRLARLAVRPGPSAAQRSQTATHVWGEVTDDQGRRAVARLHGPEPGLDWTVRAALTCVQRVLAGQAPPGYQTPAKAYGPDLALAAAGVWREDVE